MSAEISSRPAQAIVVARVHNKQEKQKTTYDVHTKERAIALNNPVFMSNSTSDQIKGGYRELYVLLKVVR